MEICPHMLRRRQARKTSHSVDGDGGGEPWKGLRGGGLGREPPYTTWRAAKFTTPQQLRVVSPPCLCPKCHGK